MGENNTTPPQPQATESTKPETPLQIGIPHQRYPREIEHQLDGLDLKILSYLAYLCKQTAKKSPSGALYAYPKEETMAARFGVRRECISLHIVKMSGLGVIKVIHRRQEQGTWRSNLYKIISWEGWRLSRIAACIHRAIDHARKPAHKILSSRVEPKAPRGLEALRVSSAGEVLQRWLSRGTASDKAST